MSIVEQAWSSSRPTLERLHARAKRRAWVVARHERTPLVVAISGAVLIGLVASAAVVMSGLAVLAAPIDETRLTARAQAAPPLSDLTLSPDALRDLSFDEARAANAALPFSTLPILSARPFVMPVDRPEDYGRALDCLTAAVYYEAASETAEGQAAVAQVVLNRSRHPAYPRTVCGVVFQGSERTTGCQFTFTCDGAMGRPPSAAGWARARAVATAALNGTVAAGVGMATHYHTNWVAPYWAPRLVKMKQIGTHIFYRWPGAWGLPTAFTGAHPGAEPVIAALAPLAEPVVEILTAQAADTPLTTLDVAAVAPRLIETVVEPAEAVEATPEPVEAPVARPAPAPAPTVMASPLAAPVATPETPVRQRRRIAAPGGW